MTTKGSIRPGIKVLFFDVFGTCVQQRKPVADELHNATREALKSAELDKGVRTKAEGMVCVLFTRRNVWETGVLIQCWSRLGKIGINSVP